MSLVCLLSSQDHPAGKNPLPPKAVTLLDSLDKAGSHSECQERPRTKASDGQHSLDSLAELFGSAAPCFMHLSILGTRF